MTTKLATVAQQASTAYEAMALRLRRAAAFHSAVRQPALAKSCRYWAGIAERASKAELQP